MEDKRIVLNKSFLYLFPVVYRELINELKLEYSFFSTNSLMTTIFNTYSYVEDNNQFSISLTHTEVSQKILESLNSSKCYITHHIDDNNFNIIFEIPEGAKDCYWKFINGSYSKYSDEDKKTIITFIETFLVSKDINQSVVLLRKVADILNKSKERASEMKVFFGLRDDEWNDDWEVGSIHDVDKENLKLL
jgi:hypothetical protein